MKKTLLTVVLATLLNALYAQDKPVMPPCLIINGAYNLAELARYNMFFSTDANPGFSGGGLLRTGEDFFLMTGLQYVLANPTMNNTLEGNSEKVSFHFVQIPLMGGIHLVKSNDSKRTLHIQIGGSLSTLLAVSDNTVGINKGSLDTFGFCFKAGIGGDIGRFVVDLNHNYLLSNLSDVPGYDNRTKLTVWEISVGYKLYASQSEGDHHE